MRETWIHKLRRYLRPRRGFLIPWRTTTRVATFWEWGGNTFRVRRHDGLARPPVSPHDEQRTVE